jgi:hypothetical protein
VSTIALILLVAYALVTIGWRAWLQQRRTGDAGLRPSPRTRAAQARRPGPRARCSRRVRGTRTRPGGRARRIAELERPLLPIAGVVCFALGFWLTVRAQLDMGESWRIGSTAGR